MIQKRKTPKTLLIILLIALVVMTGTLIITLARYVTSSTLSDNAVTAKFGFNVPTSISLFSDSYANAQSDTANKNIIAPGTSGEYTFHVTGTSEVAYKVNAAVTVIYSPEWDSYKPLEFSIDGNNWTDFESFETNLSNALASEVMNPNEDYVNTQKISWRWPFYVSAENDAKDTIVGLAAASGTALSTTVNITVTASQVE